MHATHNNYDNAHLNHTNANTDRNNTNQITADWRNADRVNADRVNADCVNADCVNADRTQPSQNRNQDKANHKSVEGPAPFSAHFDQAVPKPTTSRAPVNTADNLAIQEASRFHVSGKRRRRPRE